jgi:lysophospholipase L1-like esterase
MKSTRNQLLAILIVGIFAAAVPLTAQTNSQIADHVLPANPPTNAPQKVDLKFSFGPQRLPGWTPVTPETAYNVERGYGFDLGSKVSAIDHGGKKAGCVTGQDGKAFFFSTKLAPGAYRVTVTLGGVTGESSTTVKSETRRLMLEAVHAGPGQLQARTFLVHLRVPRLPDGTTVRFKPRERDPILVVQWDDQTSVKFTELDWDEKLTLEFSGSQAALHSVEITNAKNPVTVYLIGDSTVTDQMMEPWGAWGQMLPRWFRMPVLIANYAESGETTASFIGERRWAKLLSEIQTGDYVLMQFGINDRRIPLEQFKKYFVQFITNTRQHGATPVLVTSQNLRKLDENGKAVQTLDGYPEAMRQVAKEQNVPLIDLNTMSMKFYEALGPEKLPKAFVDGTHQNDYGSYELAKCVVNGIVEAKLPFAKYRVGDWKPFDPARPEPMEDFKVPPDPQLDPARPGVRGATQPNNESSAMSPVVNSQSTALTNAPVFPQEKTNSLN